MPKAFNELLQTERKERLAVAHSDLGGNLNLGSPEWQPIVLTTKPCHIHDGVKLCANRLGSKFTVLKVLQVLQVPFFGS